MHPRRSISGSLFLTNTIPAGLFWSDDGSLYWVIEDNLSKRAIVLRDSNDPPFSYRELDHRPIAFGEWSAAPVINLTAEANSAKESPGLLMFSGGMLSVACCSVAGSIEWINVGYGDVHNSPEHMLCDGWELHSTSTITPRFTRTRRDSRPATPFTPRELRVAMSFFEVFAHEAKRQQPSPE